jgi:hypothetical protein
LITEQHTPGQFNFNDRGLGNPQESEFALVLRDGLPLMSDWIGFLTLTTFRCRKDKRDSIHSRRQQSALRAEAGAGSKFHNQTS